MTPLPWHNSPRLWTWLAVATGLIALCGIFARHADTREKQGVDKNATKAQEAEIEKRIYRQLDRNRYIKQPGVPWVIFVRGVKGRRLVDVLFKRRDAQGNYDLELRAREGELTVDLKGKQLLVTVRHANVLNGDTRGYIESRVFAVPLGSFAAPKRSGRSLAAAKSFPWE